MHCLVPLNLRDNALVNCSTCFYSKTNEMHQFSKLFYFVVALYMFRTVFPSITRSLKPYIKHQVYVIQVLWLLASKQPQNLYDIYLMLYVQS